MTMWNRLCVLVVLGCAGPGSKDDTDTDTDTGPMNLDRRIDGLGIADTVDSVSPKLCVSPDGTAMYVSWLDRRDGFSDVWMNVSTDGGETFLPEAFRAKQGPGNATGHDLACTNDRVVIVWEDDRDGDSGYPNIYTNVSTDAGATWLAEDLAVDEDPDGIYVSIGPRIAIRGTDVHLFWYDQRLGSPDIYVATSINGGVAYGPSTRVSSPRPDDVEVFWSGNPTVNVNGAGRVHVVWEDTRNGAHDLFFSAWDRGQTPGPQVRIDTGDAEGASYSLVPSIDVDGDEVYIAWQDTRAGEGRDIYLNHSSDGGVTWQAESTRVEDDPAGFNDSLGPQVVVAGDRAHLFWEDHRNVGVDIYHRSVTAGALDPGDRQLETDGLGVANSIRPVAAADGDDLVVAWQDYRADAGVGFSDLHYNHTSLADATTWAEEDLRLDSWVEGASFKEELSIEVRAGRVFAAWVDGRNGSRDIYVSTVDVGLAVDGANVTIEDEGSAE